MKTGRCYIDFEDDYEQIKGSERNKANHSKRPPILVTVWTLYITEVVGEDKRARAFSHSPQRSPFLLNQLHTESFTNSFGFSGNIW